VRLLAAQLNFNNSILLKCEGPVWFLSVFIYLFTIHINADISQICRSCVAQNEPQNLYVTETH